MQKCYTILYSIHSPEFMLDIGLLLSVASEIREELLRALRISPFPLVLFFFLFFFSCFFFFFFFFFVVEPPSFISSGCIDSVYLSHSTFSVLPFRLSRPQKGARYWESNTVNFLYTYIQPLHIVLNSTLRD